MFRDRRKLGLLFPIVVLVTSAFALQSSLPGRDQQATFRLAGTVINSATGRPVYRALVQVPGSRDHASLTNAEGEFSFENMPQGRVQILVTKPGFVYHATSTVTEMPTSIDLGPETGKIVLKLTPAAVIYGTVTSNDDEPLERATVEVISAGVIDGRQQFRAVRAGILSNADGKFRISGLAPGRYYLGVSPSSTPRNGVAPGPGGVLPKLLYYSSSFDLESATPIDLTPGMHAEASIRVDVVPGYRVAGVITSVDGRQEISPPLFVDEVGKTLMEPEQFNARSGVFEFRGVPAGRYLLQLGSTDAQGRRTISLRHVTVETNTADLRLTVYPAIDIPVIVRTQFGQTHAAQCASSDPKTASSCMSAPSARVELHSLESASLNFYSESALRSSSSPMMVSRVVPGRYLVRARPVFGNYVQSIQCGDVNLLLDPLVVPEGGQLPPIEVLVRDDEGTMNIQVHKDAPEQQVLVAIFSEPRAIADPQVINKSDGTGTFQSGPLAPGVYRVLAFDAADDVEYTDPDVLATYASQVVTVNVAPREGTNVVANVVRAER
jgi:hypothetical protein